MSRADDVLEAATRQGDVRLLAAAARAGEALPPRAADRLGGLAEAGLRVDVARRGTHADVVVSPADDWRLPADADPPPALITATTMRRALVAALIACTEPGGQPGRWPGRVATVGEVLSAAGVADSARTRHTKGALRHLDRHRILALDDEAVSESAPVRLGPAVAGWPESLLEEIDALLRAGGVLPAGGQP